jgi:hypothetical protein
MGASSFQSITGSSNEAWKLVWFAHRQWTACQR